MMDDIQKVNTQDYQQLVDLWEKATKKSHYFLTEKEIIRDKNRLIADYFPNMTLYKIEKDGKIIAFIGLCQEWIEMLAVDPDHQQKGLGKKLVTVAAKEKKSIRVDVYEKNRQARIFYQKMGFYTAAKSEIKEGRKKRVVLHLKKTQSQVQRATPAAC